MWERAPHLHARKSPKALGRGARGAGRRAGADPPRGLAGPGPRGRGEAAAADEDRGARGDQAPQRAAPGACRGSWAARAVEWVFRPRGSTASGHRRQPTREPRAPGSPGRPLRRRLGQLPPPEEAPCVRPCGPPECVAPSVTVAQMSRVRLSPRRAQRARCPGTGTLTAGPRGQSTDRRVASEPGACGARGSVLSPGGGTGGGEEGFGRCF